MSKYMLKMLNTLSEKASNRDRQCWRIWECYVGESGMASDI